MRSLWNDLHMNRFRLDAIFCIIMYELFWCISIAEATERHGKEQRLSNVEYIFINNDNSQHAKMIVLS